MRAHTEIRTDEYKATIDVTADDIERELNRSADHIAAERERGVEEMRMVYRAGWWGRCAFQKEVGPPPWRLPHVYVTPSPRRRAIRLGIGWRSTLYTVLYMAKPLVKEATR